MGWLINRNSKIAWQSSSLAALLIVSLCCLVTLADMLFVDDADDAIFVLMPATALVLLCSALITAAALFSWWHCHLWLLVGTVTAVCIGLMFGSNGSFAMFNDIGLVQAVCWFVLLLSWVLWFWPKYGRIAMITLNNALLLFSLSLVLLGMSDSHIQLSHSPLTSLNSAIFYSLCALANIAFCLSHPKRLHIELRSLGLILSIFIASAVTLIWFNNTHRIQQQVNTESALLSVRLQQNIDDLLVTQQGLLTRMAKRAAMLSANINDAYFTQEAQGYLTDFPYIEYLALRQSGINTVEHNTQLSAARTTAEQDWYDDYLRNRLNHNELVILPRVAESIFYVDYDEVIDHTLLYVFYRPDISAPTQIAIASINYQLALGKVIDSILTSDIKLQISQAAGAEVLYQSALFPARCIKQFQFSIALTGSTSWQVLGCNNLRQIPSGLLISSEIALYAGFIAIFLALLSQQLQQKSQQHQTRLVSANVKLRQSVNEQQVLRFKQQQIMENSADVICIVDAAGCFFELSPSAEVIFGYPLKELLGKPFLNFVHPGDRNLTSMEADNLKDGRSTFNFRNRYLRKDGSVVHLLWSARFVTESQMIYAIAHDISELERQERFQIAQQSILKLISLEGAISDIFSQICLMAQQQMPGVKAALMLADHNMLRLIAAPAFSPRLRAEMSDIAIQSASFTCAIAAYQRSLEITHNLALAPAWSQLERTLCDEAGKTCWSMPMVTNQGSVLGTFDLYVNDARAPKSDELELMLLCCRLASIAVEKMQQRKALQENEQRYRSLYEFNPDPVFSLDLAGNFLNINSAGVALLGRNEEQIIGQHYARLILPELLAKVDKHFAIALQGTAQRYETVVQVPGGSPVEFLITNLPIIVDNKVVGVFGIAKDITERNQTARDLQRQLQFNTAVTNSMSDVLLVTDMTGNVSVLNPSAERLLAQCGISMPHQLISEILPLNPHTWLPGHYYDSELELDIAKQRLSYVCKVSPLRTSDNQVGWLVTLHDISAERRADAVSQERDQFFTLSLELFCLVDLDGCFVQVNPAFSQVLEYQSSDLIGQPYMSVIDARDHQLIVDTVATLRQGRDIHDLEFRVISRSGHLCWLQLSAALSGNIIFCAARDITARKASEKQLEQTLQELKRSNEELNEFAYVASHDLQEPLRKIRTFGDRLLQKVSHEDAAVQDYVLRMRNAAERMQNLINDLLTYSRLNAGQLECKEVDMAALMQDVQNLLEELITQTSASITIDVHSNIVGDERQLRQLLQNLVSNAIKFHKPEQPPQITIASEQVDDEVLLTVTDQGIGFEQQYADKIFNPFQRLHSRAEFAGTGIGLSIVKKIAERHGATVSVIAKVNCGASFQIRFPSVSAQQHKSATLIALHGGDYAQNSAG